MKRPLGGLTDLLIRALFERGSTSADYPVTSRVGGVSQSTQAGVRIDPDQALRVATVWACVRFLSQGVAQLPWRVMTPAPGGGFQASDPGRGLAYLLSRRPNPETSAFAFRETMTAWALLYGNAVAEIVRDGGGKASALWPIHPQRVSFWRDVQSQELIYRISSPYPNAGRPAIVQMRGEDLFHLRGMGDGAIGLSVIAYAAESIGWARATEVFGSSFFGNGLNPNGILKTKGRLTPEGLDELRKEIKDTYQGPKNALRALILDADMDWTAISTNANDAQFIETRQHQIEEICRWFGCPPHKVQHLVRSTFANIEHQAIETVVDALVPWCLRFEQEADYKLLAGNRGGAYTRLDTKGLLRGDFKTRTEGYKLLREIGVLSVNEIRDLEDMNPIDGDAGDLRIVPVNMADMERMADGTLGAPAGQGGGKNPTTTEPAEKGEGTGQEAEQQMGARYAPKHMDAAEYERSMAYRAALARPPGAPLH